MTQHKGTLPAQGRKLAANILASLPTCPIPEIAQLGRTLNQSRDAFSACHTTSGATNGDIEATNGLTEMHRRLARGFTNPRNYRLRMLLMEDARNYDPHSSTKNR